jgi:putative phosphoribosyl transferase
MVEPFRDRFSAGKELAIKLLNYASLSNVIVLGLPRGGVEVAYEVALRLNAELDVFLVRKLGAPFEPELAMGAIAEGGILLLNDAVVNYMGISKDSIESAAKQELAELERRLKLYRNGRPALELKGKTVLIVDDGLATGATMKAALKAIKRKEPQKIIVAVPVGAPTTCMEIKSEADEVICLKSPEPFTAVGSWYNIFEQTTDQQVQELLKKASDRFKNDL